MVLTTETAAVEKPAEEDEHARHHHEDMSDLDVTASVTEALAARLSS